MTAPGHVSTKKNIVPQHLADRIINQLQSVVYMLYIQASIVVAPRLWIRLFQLKGEFKHLAKMNEFDVRVGVEWLRSKTH